MLSLKERLAVYLDRHYPNWLASGEIQRIVMAKTTYTGRTVVRRLEELARGGVLEVRYGGKNHAFYRTKKNTPYNDISPGQGTINQLIANK